MRSTKKIFTLALAIFTILSVVSTQAFATIESPIIPMPSNPQPEEPTAELVLKAAPAKTAYYQNESLDLTGAEVEYTVGESTTPVTITADMVTGFNPSVLGEQTVTITYESLTVTFTVTVVERLYVPGDLDGDNDVDSDDAVYLLFNTLFGERYPVTQPVDFDNSGVVDSDDAVYLLFHTLFGERYPIA